MRIFRHEIQTALRVLGVAIVVAMIVLPLAWGYEQRRQARAWQALACEYRMRALVRWAPLLASADRAGDACVTLRRLGLDIGPGR